MTRAAAITTATARFERGEFTRDLAALVAIPSESQTPEGAPHLRAYLDHITPRLRAMGFTTEIIDNPLPGAPPLLLGERIEATELPTILTYGHGDVTRAQTDAWAEGLAPFVLTERGEKLYGRGAADNKGPLITNIAAVAQVLEENPRLPLRITFLIEGEEESGSPSLIPFMEKNAAELKSDIALICDTSMVSPGVPSIASQLRGMLKDEFTLTGPRIDLHSGHYGGPALNPLAEIARIVAALHDDQGRVTVPGFYEGVYEISDNLRAQWGACGFDEETYLNSVGFTQSHGEAGYSTLELQWARPTLEINGLWGGYQGAGSKTVIPSKAHCKFTCRLVGDQDPDALRDRIRAHVESLLRPDCKIKWDTDLEGSPAPVMNTERPEFEQARKALSDEWSREAVLVGMGGSIPIAGFFKSVLGMDAMLIGFANDDDAIHSPNEKYDVESFHKGIRSWARILAELSA